MEEYPNDHNVSVNSVPMPPYRNCDLQNLIHDEPRKMLN